ncbi:MAG: hypothetical protein WC863_04920 [Patescibacteria group bacterium]
MLIRLREGFPCALEYRKTKLESKLERGLKELGIVFGEYTTNNGRDLFALSRTAEGNGLEIEYLKELKDDEKRKNPKKYTHKYCEVTKNEVHLIGYAPILNNIALINNPKHFQEIISINDKEQFGKDNVLSTIAFFVNNGVTSDDPYIAGEIPFDGDFLEFIGKKIKGIDNHSPDYSAAFVLEAVKNYQPFLKNYKFEK